MFPNPFVRTGLPFGSGTQGDRTSASQSFSNFYRLHPLLFPWNEPIHQLLFSSTQNLLPYYFSFLSPPPPPPPFSFPNHDWILAKRCRKGQLYKKNMRPGSSRFKGEWACSAVASRPMSRGCSCFVIEMQTVHENVCWKEIGDLYYVVSLYFILFYSFVGLRK